MLKFIGTHLLELTVLAWAVATLAALASTVEATLLACAFASTLTAALGQKWGNRG